MHMKSAGNTFWTIGKVDETLAQKLADTLGISDFTARLMASRGITDPDAAKEYLFGRAELLHDPFLLPDMEKAVERIQKALADNEKILIYGDYDVDGVTSVSLLLLYLREHGGNVDYYIPERIREGYGLNKAAIERFAAGGVNLIITVDSGITASDEVAFAAEYGIDVVVTDHHECREELPKAVAVVNPHRSDSVYPFAELAGVGVVFKLVCALEGNKNIARICSKYADIASLGTVADVMPIVGENRVIVKLGLERLEKTSNEGLYALIHAAFSEKRSAKNRKLNTASIGFGLAPRINAAGRIGDVNRAVKLLITENKQEATNIADYLCSVNRERQLIENQIFEQAVEKLESTKEYENDKVIVLTSDHWHLGVIGIVASKLTDRYGLPSILISFDGDVGKGSGRSVKGFNINEAISRCKEYLIKYGGHELAAGLTVARDQVDAFREKINAYAAETFDFDHISTELHADMELQAEEFSLENALELTKLEPFGLHNEEPLFYMADVSIREIISIGEGKHIKLILEKDGVIITAVYFGMPKEEFPFFEGIHADFLFNMGYNDFRGCRTVQMFVRDVRPESKAYAAKHRSETLFTAVKTGLVACPKEHIPELIQFRTVFLYLKATLREYGKPLELLVFRSAARISTDYKTVVTPCMFNIALEVFAEMKLIELERKSDPDTVKITLVPTTGKVDLNNSAFLKRIKAKSEEQSLCQ